MTGSFVNINETSGSNKAREFPEFLSDCQFLRKGSVPYDQLVT
jgi:hypothetical protein